MNEEIKKSVSALREEEVLKFWNENKIFEKSLEKDSPKGEYIFYEGPPTANGKPGIHHLEARAFKDAIPRYKTMRGYHVRRKGGWDTHGLPVELQVEKKLGLTSKKAIEDYGIAKFNKECRESVWEYTDIWEKFTERIGYWVDQKNPYVTYHNDYIESVWNVIKEANKQNLLYKDYKVVPWCPRCGTGLSSHELAQGYQDVKDLSVYAKFKVIASPDASVQVLGRGGREPAPDHSHKHAGSALDTYILAWTTTPWTLPGNVALAVGKDIKYLKIKKENEIFILAESCISIIEGEYEILEKLKGSDLIGLEYEPLYPYLSETISDGEKPKLEKAFKIYNADFVTTEDGTGVVHTAVMYGVDDFVLGSEIGLPKHHLVGLDGKFYKGTGFLEGRFVRDEEVAVDIIKDLAHRGLLFKKEKYEHSYPHCWRCKTALIYYARDSWYIRMSSLKDKLVKENEGINWEPSYIKDGRFGDWLREIKDWAISRERYWGTPLPVWICNTCKKIEVLGSIDEIKIKTKKSGNKYFVMRHGEAENNTLDVLNSVTDIEFHLTELGKQQVQDASKKIKDVKFDYVFVSPLLRTIETLNIIKEELDLTCPIFIEEKIREKNSGDYEGKSPKELYATFKNFTEEFTIRPNNGECINDVKKRIGDFIYDLELKYQNKNILIVSHGDPVWMSQAILNGMDTKQEIEYSENNYPKNAEIKEFEFIKIPHNDNYELDLHKPFIEEVQLICSCGGNLKREKEVMDVWLDSGTMPFSQDHYPFDNKEFVEKSYPADFISEAIDQTRGWFYTLHAVGIIMGKGKAYKNVICLGHLLDASGKKMSKSLGNIVDPWIMIDKYGVDTLRLWMYGVNQPGESKNFDEKTVSELHNKVFNLLYNVLAFYELYRDKSLETRNYKLETNSNVLDQWIVTRLDQLIESTTNNLNNYKLLEPVRAIRDFIDDLSTWYVRRSRERLKENDKEAKQTLYYVIKTLIKLMAPFTPFTSEDIWQKLKISRVSMDGTRHDFAKSDPESVHLENWPGSQLGIKNEELKIIEEMTKVREVVTLGLQARQKSGIPVRQPLKELIIKNYELPKEYEEIVKDELNVKEIKIVEGEEKKVELDTNITEDLKQEGNYRELVRAIQDIRKKNGLNPSDLVTLFISAGVTEQELINKFKNELIKATGSKEIQIKENDGVEIKIDDLVFKINLVK